MINKIKTLLLGLMIFPSAAIALSFPVSPGSAIAPAPVGSNDGNSYSGDLINSPGGLAYSGTAVLDLAKYDASKVSAQVLFSTVIFSNPTFTDGSQSTGNVKVLSYTALSSASATDQLTVTTNAFTTGVSVTIANNILTMGQQFQRGATIHATAANLAAAISLLPSLAASVGGGTSGVVYATATYGSYANTWAFVSNNSSVTAASALMSGGQDNAVVTINGVAVTQGLGTGQWQAVTSNAVTATNLAAAINTAFSTLTSSNGAVAQAIVYSTSVLNGSAYNYSFVSSTPTALVVNSPTFTGGTNPGDVLGSMIVTARAASNLTLGLPVLYAIGTNPAIGGLVTGTTYYAVPLSATQFELVKYATSAVAGSPLSDFVTITSTNSQTSAHTYTITPLTWNGGAATFIWQSSNDNTDWFASASTGTVTIYSTTTATDLPIDFGTFNYRYLRLNYTAPATGAVNLVVPVNIKQDGIGRF